MVRPTTEEAARIAERRTRALRLRIDYHTNQQIADLLQDEWPGLTASTVSADVQQAMRDRREQQAAAADELRDMELDRLETLAKAATEVLRRRHVLTSGGKVVRDIDIQWDATLERYVVVGDTEPLADDGPTLQAIETLRKLSESRRRLLGLDQPAKLETSQTVRFAVDGIDPQALK